VIAAPSDSHGLITADANLTIPSFTVTSAELPDRRVNNSKVRFLKRITIKALPKAGETVQLSAQFGDPFDATVTQVDWNDRKDCFVIACRFARRSITSAEHERLLRDPEWSTHQLP